ncbi:MAG: hypothetical protein GWN46_13480, partial [Gammaproteobacteria bacterium]|nr:hypothetical protein [Gammaproteobacteria bacterium]
GKDALGDNVKIYVNGVMDQIHTGGLSPFAEDRPAPMDGTDSEGVEMLGVPSTNWF